MRRPLGQEVLEESNRFQDWVADLFDKELHLSLSYCVSYQEQLKTGESRQGVEVKYDRRYQETGNLYIEIAERRNTNEPFVQSGIWRDDNSWLIAIGDYQKVFLLSKRQLQIWQRHTKPRIVETATSGDGYLISLRQQKT